MNIIKTNVPQDPLQAALMQNAQLNSQLHGANMLTHPDANNGWGGGLGILAAALGGYMQNKKGKELAANEYDINQQIAAFQAQKQQEMAEAEQVKKDKEAKAKLDALIPTYGEEKAKAIVYGGVKPDQFKGPDPTSQMQNLQSMGLQPGTPEWNKAMGGVLNKNTAPVVNVNNGKTQSVWDETLAKENVKSYIGWRDDANAASQTLQTINRLEPMITAMETGRWDQVQAIAGQLWGSDKAADMQTVQAITGDLVLGELSRLKGSSSDKELEKIESLQASYDKTPQANKQIIDYIKSKSQNSIDRFKAADDHKNKHGNLQTFAPSFQEVLFSGQQEAQPQQQAQQTKSIGGKTYVQIDGQWYEQ